MTEFYKLPDTMSSEILRDKFIEFIAYYNKANIIEYDISYVLDELYELSDRQWHTYELMEDDIKQQIESFIISILDFENADIMGSVLSIIPRLGLKMVFLYIIENKERISNKEVNELVRGAEMEYGSSVDNPYSGML